MVDSNNHKIEISISDSFDEGAKGKIYTCDDYLIKVFNKFKLNKKVLFKIKELNLKNFYNIKDFIYTNRLHLLKGYSMDRIVSEDIDLFTVDMNYIKTNYYNLLNVFNILSENNIRIYDLRYYNSIINRDGMFIIDCDNYVFSNSKYLKDINKEALIFYLKQCILLSIARHHKQSLWEIEFYLNRCFDDLEIFNYENVYEYMKSKCNKTKIIL